MRPRRAHPSTPDLASCAFRFRRDLRVLEKLELNNRVQIALLAHDAGEA